ncbi:glycosyltransferase family 25 protein [Silicimonas algicola]|uniref:Glycosyl transferase family 25 n=1 Tax=Silicimonas algicola TaxID=1826607 RepID=A0A316GBC5_9RHOB|nr:glycosyltransferase family 25 protein [Silicimonas algicola]PWK58198.1 glycosyl transferase family 25 [Silicimonas algicola]
MAKRLTSAALTAFRRPGLVRNRVFGTLNYWPVSRLTNERLRLAPYFCINLTSSTRRRALAQRQASRMGLERFEFHDAIVGRDLNVTDLIKKGLYDDVAAKRYHGRSLSLTEIAISLTHARIYSEIISRDLEEAVILEDDVLFLPRNINALNSSNVPSDFDVFFLHAQLDEEPPRGKIANGVHLSDSYVASSVAYLISRRGAEKLARGSKPVVHASDGLLGRALPWDGDRPHSFRQQGVSIELNAYLMHPPGALNGSTCHFVGSTIPEIFHSK